MIWQGSRRQKRVRPRRDFSALERRRQLAARAFARGDSQAEVAHRLLVSRQSVSRWHHQWQTSGSLRGTGRAGRKPRLTSKLLAAVEQALRGGAQAHGFGTELWTLPRAAEVIARQTGARYHPGHVWRLHRALHWTLQRPARRAAERDEAAIRRWVKEGWPVAKKTPDDGGPRSSSRMKAETP
jgi:transposase